MSADRHLQADLQDAVVRLETLQDMLNTTINERDAWKKKFLSERALHDEDGVALVRAVCERDRLRRELEALREACRIPARYGATRKYIVTRLDAILQGKP